MASIALIAEMWPTNNKQKTQDVRICLGRPSCVFDKIEDAIMYEVTPSETTCNETTKRITTRGHRDSETTMPGNRTGDPGSLYRVLRSVEIGYGTVRH